LGGNARKKGEGMENFLSGTGKREVCVRRAVRKKKGALGKGGGKSTVFVRRGGEKKDTP